MTDEQKPQPEPVWCVSANIVAERPCGPGGAEMRSGTKHFKAGAKVYCVAFHAGWTRVDVVGHHRGSYHLVRMAIRPEWLTDFKTELVYSPYVISQFLPSRPDVHDKLIDGPASKSQVEEFTAHMKVLESKRASMHTHQKEQDVVVSEGGGEEHGVDAV